MKSRALIAFAWGFVSQKTCNQSEPQKVKIDPLQKATIEANKLIHVFKETCGIPGISVCISIGGNTVYSKGFGFADVEQLVKASSNTKYRIASISKCFTSLLAGRLVDQGRLNLDEDIHTYLPDFPAAKTEAGKIAAISVRHLLSHTSGLRHYRKLHELNDKGDVPEMFSTKAYESAHDALTMFQSDYLLHLPGEDYSYTTHGFTLISAVIESIVATSYPNAVLFEKPDRLRQKKDAVDGKDSQKLPSSAKFQNIMGDLFVFLGLKNTCLDYNDKIVSFRTKQYRRNKQGRLINVPIVDNSYKWGGGGILSSAPDLIQVANHLSEIFLRDDEKSIDNVVSRETLANLLWKPVKGTLQGRWLAGGLYGFGWFVAKRSAVPADKDTRDQFDRLLVGHLGGALGGTTALVINLPILASRGQKTASRCQDFSSRNQIVSTVPPIAVAILTNLEGVAGIGTLALQLSEVFTTALVDNFPVSQLQQPFYPIAA